MHETVVIRFDALPSPPLDSHVEQHGVPGVYPELPFVEHESVALGRHESLHLAHQAGSGAPRLDRQRLRHAGLGVPAVEGSVGPCHDSALTLLGVIGGGGTDGTGSTTTTKLADA